MSPRRGDSACGGDYPNYHFPEDGIKSLAAADRLVTLHEIPRREIPAFTDLDVEGAKKSSPQHWTGIRSNI